MTGSVHDVERVAQSLIESSAGDLVEPADRFVVEIVERDGDHVVAADDAPLGKSVFGAELDFCVASQHADWSGAAGGPRSAQ